MLLLISYLILFISLLVCVAFYTLLERKILGYIQIRKGPNKVGVGGLLQPFSDGLKLIFKGQFWPSYSNKVLFYLSPIFGLFFCLLYWALVDLGGISFLMKYGFLYFLVISSLGVYPILGAGWSSNSLYSMLGCYRAVAQTISYEICLALILLGVILLTGDYCLVTCYDFSFVKLGLLFLLMGVWFLSCLAETNRSPFDFAEGESELVSGFNVEYGGGGFALIFIAEYANIIFMGVMSCILFLSLNFFIVVLFIMIIFLWVRGSFPRYRYDKLMGLAWKSLLPFVLGYFLFLYGLLLIYYFVSLIELNLEFK